MLLSYPPNTDSIVEELQFKTDILTNSDGSEQRVRTRTIPRSQVNCKLRVPDNERNHFNALLYTALNSAVYAPSWWDFRRLTQNTGTGNNNIWIDDTANGDYPVGGQIVLFTDYQTYEICTITGQSGSRLIVSTNRTKNWLAVDTIVMPIHRVYLGHDIGQTNYLRSISDIALKYLVTDSYDMRDGTPSTYGTYLNKPLVNRNNSTGQNSGSSGWTNQPIVFDPGGLYSESSNWNRPKLVGNLRIKTTSYADTHATRRFFHQLGGRHKSFWLGTGTNDLPPNTGTGAGQGYIQIDLQGFVSNYGTNPVAPRGHLQIVRTNGVRTQHSIDLALAFPTVEHLGLTPAVSPALDLSEVNRVEFLTLCRLNTDTVTIKHLPNGKAIFEAETIGVSA